jgi:hypothetical protein
MGNLIGTVLVGAVLVGSWFTGKARAWLLTAKSKRRVDLRHAIFAKGDGFCWMQDVRCSRVKVRGKCERVRGGGYKDR